MDTIDKGFLRFPSNLNRSYFPRKSSRFPTSLPNPAFAPNPPPSGSAFSSVKSPSFSRIICPLPPPLIWPCNLSGELNLGKILWEIVKHMVIASHRLNDHWRLSLQFVIVCKKTLLQWPYWQEFFFSSPKADFLPVQYSHLLLQCQRQEGLFYWLHQIENQAKGFNFPRACCQRYQSLHAVCCVFPYEVLHFLATSFPGKTAYPVYTINNTVLTHQHTQDCKSLDWGVDWISQACIRNERV